MENMGQRALAQRQSDTRIVVLGSDRIEFISESSWHSPGKEAGPRGTAIRRGEISLGEPDAIHRHGIDVGSRNLLVSVTAQLAVPKVVGDQQDDVRLCRLRAGITCARQHQRYNRRKKEVRLHGADPVSRHGGKCGQFRSADGIGGGCGFVD